MKLKFKKKLTLLVGFCLLLVIPKTTCKKKRGGREYHPGKHKHRASTSKKGIATRGEQQQQGGVKGTLKKSKNSKSRATMRRNNKRGVGMWSNNVEE